MKAPEKRICKSESHPHKQKWYWYEEGFCNPDFCSTCAFAISQMAMILRVILTTQRTLYGDKPMRLSKGQVHAIVNEIYDEISTER